MKFRRKGCCFLFPLNRGCFVIAMILIFIEAIAPPLRDPGSRESLGGLLAGCYRVLSVIHSMGCLLLILASFMTDSALVVIFLCTIMLHIILLPGFLYFDINFWHTNMMMDTIIAIAGEILSIYSFAMAVLYYRECKREIIVKYRGSVTFAPDVP